MASFHSRFQLAMQVRQYTKYQSQGTGTPKWKAAIIATN